MLPDPTRRDVLAQGVTAGIAAAVTPSFAWGASTTSAHVEAHTVTVGEIPAYVARPRGRGPFPVVLVAHEIFGVHAWIQDICRRLAQEGYVAIAPYLYSRQGDVTALPTVQDIFGQVVAKVATATVLDDLDAALDWAVVHAHGDAVRAAVTGFCWGGTATWLYAAHNPRLKAGAAWYGKLANPRTDLVPRNALDLAPTLTVPVLGLYGAQDASIPADDVAAMRAALATGTSGSEIVVYPTAGHGFLADYRPSFDPVAAADAWPRMLAWLRAHGVG